MDSENSVFTMPVAPAYNGGNNGGFGFGSDWAWIILLLVLCGGWGNGIGGFGGGAMPFMMGGMAAGGWELYPWMNQSNQISGGFRDQMIQNSITGIGDKVVSGFGDLQTSLCAGFAGVNAGISNGFAQAEIANNARQIADMQQNFAAQTATMQGFSGLQAQLAQCCCDNRAATQDLKYTLATEACATRTANTQNTQAILDKLCQLELDGYKRENDQLRTQLNLANLAASQTAQTAELRTSQATIANQLVSELRSCPIPSQPVYGNTPIFSCGGNTGCGCGM